MEEKVNDLQLWYDFHVKENKSTWTMLMEKKIKNKWIGVYYLHIHGF